MSDDRLCRQERFARITPEQLCRYKFLSGATHALAASMFVLWTVPTMLYGAERALFAFFALGIALLICAYALIPHYIDDSAHSYSPVMCERLEWLSDVALAAGVGAGILSALPILLLQSEFGFALGTMGFALALGAILFARAIRPRLDRRARQALPDVQAARKTNRGHLAIVGGACLAVVCVALLVAAAQNRFQLSVNFVQGNPARYRNSGNAKIEQTVSAIHLDWLGGSVTIEGYEGTVVEIFETCNGETVAVDEQLRWQVSNEVLHVCFDAKSRYALHWGEIEPKDLTIRVPLLYLREVLIDAPSSGVELSRLTVGRSVEVKSHGPVSVSSVTQKKLEIRTVSGDISVDGGNTGELYLCSESGMLSCKDFLCTNASLSTLSGKTVLENVVFDALELKTHSGDVSVTVDTLVREMCFETKDADVTVLVPRDLVGFTADLDGGAGRLLTSLPTVQSGNAYVFGNGEMRLYMKSKSGALFIEQKP